MFVKLHLRVPLQSFQRIQSTFANKPLIVSALLENERKLSILHFKVEKLSGSEVEIKSKEQLVFDFGFRRVAVKPIFSESFQNCEKLKFQKHLLPDKPN